MSQLPALHEQDDWVGLTTVVMVVRSIQHWNKTTHEVQFYISSLSSNPEKLVAQFDNTGELKILFIGHSYVTFHEDECRIRSLHSPQNFALLRRIARLGLRTRNIFSPQYSPKDTASRYERSVYAFCAGGGCLKLELHTMIRLSTEFETR